MAIIAFIKYKHHGKRVFVRADLRGKHWDFCLCKYCSKLKIGKEDNCKIANLVYAVDKQCHLVTPVWECPNFKEIK